MKNENIIGQIEKFLTPDCQIPESSSMWATDNETSCAYLCDCVKTKHLWSSSSLKKVTGYESVDLERTLEW